MAKKITQRQIRTMRNLMERLAYHHELKLKPFTKKDLLLQQEENAKLAVEMLQALVS